MVRLGAIEAEQETLVRPAGREHRSAALPEITGDERLDIRCKPLASQRLHHETAFECTVGLLCKMLQRAAAAGVAVRIEVATERRNPIRGGDRCRKKCSMAAVAGNRHRLARQGMWHVDWSFGCVGYAVSMGAEPIDGYRQRTHVSFVPASRYS